MIMRCYTPNFYFKKVTPNSEKVTSKTKNFTPNKIKEILHNKSKLLHQIRNILHQTNGTFGLPKMEFIFKWLIIISFV